MFHRIYRLIQCEKYILDANIAGRLPNVKLKRYKNRFPHLARNFSALLRASYSKNVGRSAVLFNNCQVLANLRILSPFSFSFETIKICKISAFPVVEFCWEIYSSITSN